MLNFDEKKGGILDMSISEYTKVIGLTEAYLLYRGRR
jgi:hypothetical protein